ncbi:MAG: transposase [Candidatus Limnocylindrales bacterium]
MGYNFRAVERDQAYLMPPSLRDWLPDDHLAWFVLDVVDALDLAAIRARYRADGWGAPAFDPALMTALLLYAYASGERSSRRIEARCRTDVAYRVICANEVPDHATIARFRADHAAALGALFHDVLRLCAAAGLGQLGLIAIDGTKLAADASARANRAAPALEAEIGALLAEAAAVDAAEDATSGPEQRGDELPPALADRPSRLARLLEARRQLTELAAAAEATSAADRERWAAREAAGGQALPGRPPQRTAVNRQHWAERNTTDPDSRKLRARDGWVQGYNGQVAVAADGLILAATLTQAANDVGQLAPLVEAARANVRAAGFGGRFGTVLADTGYWSEANFTAVETAGRTRLLIPPPRGKPRGPTSHRPPTPGRARMRQRLARPPNAAVYRRRAGIVEPVFGQLKAVRGVRRFERRGFSACASEWRLLCLTHNLLKLWRYRGGGGGPAGGGTPRPPRIFRRRRRSRR